MILGKPKLSVCCTSWLFRYIMVIKVSDPTGEAWLSLFNDQAEKIVGCSADELDRIRKEVIHALVSVHNAECSFCNLWLTLLILFAGG
jgi:hypothetical protein